MLWIKTAEFEWKNEELDNMTCFKGPRLNTGDNKIGETYVKEI